MIGAEETMKIVMSVRDLDIATNFAGRAYPSTTILFRLTGEGRIDDRIELLAANSDFCLSTFAPLKSAAGPHREFSMDARMLRAIVSTFDRNGDVEITAGPNSITFAQGDDWITTHQSWEYHCAVGEKAEILETALNPWTALSRELAEAVRGLREAMGTEPIRFYLEGIYFDLSRKDQAGRRMPCLVATDGHRLAIEYLDPKLWPERPGFVLPAAAVAKVAQMPMESSVAVAFEGDKFFLQSGPNRLAVKTWDCYVDYVKVIPVEFSFHLRLRRADLTKALTKVGLGGPDVQIWFQPERNNILSVENNGSLAEAKTAIPILAESGDVPDAFCFNLHYLRDMLEHLGGNEIDVAGTSEHGVFVFTDPSNPLRLHAIMPMRG